MVLSNENNSQVVGEMDMVERKFGAESKQNRRALSDITQNIESVQQIPFVNNKRDLSQTNGFNEKNHPFQAEIPITRKFAAQIASSNPPFLVENKKQKLSEDVLCIWEDSPVSNVQEHDEEAKDFPVPMSLESTDEVTNEKDQMEEKEVEMEDIFEEPITDIDSCDANNPLAVIDYVEELYAHYRKMEDSSIISPNYMVQQSDINEKMRAILVDWLIEVHHKFELRDITLYLTVNLIDRYLEKQSVERKKLQLVGLVAMLLACKYEEISIPVVSDLVFISDKAYSRNDIIEMESLMLNTLDFNMSVPTSYVFMTRYLKAAQSDNKLESLSFFLIELCLVEYEMLKFSPSLLAAAAIYTAQCTQYGIGQWSKTCEWHSNYSEDDLLECSRKIVSIHQKAATSKLTGVQRKYCSSKFGYTTKCQPAYYLLEDTK